MEKTRNILLLDGGSVNGFEDICKKRWGFALVCLALGWGTAGHGYLIPISKGFDIESHKTKKWDYKKVQFDPLRGVHVFSSHVKKDLRVFVEPIVTPTLSAAEAAAKQLCNYHKSLQGGSASNYSYTLAPTVGGIQGCVVKNSDYKGFLRQYLVPVPQGPVLNVTVFSDRQDAKTTDLALNEFFKSWEARK